MWEYAVNSLAWSALGLIVGAGLAELGYDLLGPLVRHSGRRNKDDHT